MTQKTIHPWLLEFGQGLQLVGGVTPVTLTSEFSVLNARKIIWAQESLQRWRESVIGQDPSISIGDININTSDLFVGPFGNFGENRKNPWERKDNLNKAKVKIEFTVPGQLASAGYAKDIANSLSGQLKKILALRLAEEFPLPTDGGGIQTLPKFCWDALYIANEDFGTNPGYKSPHFAASASVIRETKQVLENYPVSVSIVLEEDWQHLLLEVIWTEEMTDKRRREVEYALAKHYRNLKNFPKPPTEAHFVVW